MTDKKDIRKLSTSLVYEHSTISEMNSGIPFSPLNVVSSNPAASKFEYFCIKCFSKVIFLDFSVIIPSSN